jgi:hypothetical protein
MVEWLSFCRPGESEIIIPVTIRGEDKTDRDSKPKTVTNLHRLMQAYLAIDQANGDLKNPITPPLDAEWTPGGLVVRGICKFDIRSGPDKPGLLEPRDPRPSDPLPPVQSGFDDLWFRFTWSEGVTPDIPGQLRGGAPSTPNRIVTPPLSKPETKGAGYAVRPHQLRIQVGEWHGLAPTAPQIGQNIGGHTRGAPLRSSELQVRLIGTCAEGIWMGSSGLTLPDAKLSTTQLQRALYAQFDASGWNPVIAGPDILVCGPEGVTLRSIACWSELVRCSSVRPLDVEVGVRNRDSF